MSENRQDSLTPTRLTPVENVPLARHATMGLGGPARYFIEAPDEQTVRDALEWATSRGLELRVLGGGSNLLVADEGVDGLVLKIGLRGVGSRESSDVIELTAAAGEPWDDLVRFTVERGWAGLECLSGIPGLVGATPIQNVGAYGQEVSETLTHVRALDRRTGRVVTLSPEECAFAYRDSMFRSGEPGRYVVLAVGYRLVPGGAPAVRYADVETDLERRGIRSPSLADVRRSVLDIRRSKSMVLDPHDENRRSCGSFFLNPVVSGDEFSRIEARAGSAAMPRWRTPDGRVKLSAAWLIEHAGFTRGYREGAVGLSSRHTLAIVCHGGARAADVVALARRLRARVEERFGVRLRPEPVFWGAIGLD
ncbi:MAG TPA: UDP-N-acetylmuramate dehydrogenase [Methylomirabilota bacterium]|nr:UDP-N-acetylmuramate dehydrogenase [Methylomirabilota bacterium]